MKLGGDSPNYLSTPNTLAPHSVVLRPSPEPETFDNAATYHYTTHARYSFVSLSSFFVICLSSPISIIRFL